MLKCLKIQIRNSVDPRVQNFQILEKKHPHFLEKRKNTRLNSAYKYRIFGVPQYITIFQQRFMALRVVFLDNFCPTFKKQDLSVDVFGFQDWH